MPDIRKETDGPGVVEVPADKPCVLRPDAPWRSALCGRSD
jgi:hypothetical protein